jgi:hypothetical protein
VPSGAEAIRYRITSRDGDQAKKTDFEIGKPANREDGRGSKEAVAYVFSAQPCARSEFFASGGSDGR